ncbi:putative ATP-dependent RNA helicase TDRD12 [Pitangus sulphuratus]|nr:putative ATP-dependent RNA helicase TDRD12 [Pitangus sulphuratus]
MNVPQGIIMDVVVLKIEDPSCFWLAVEECVPGLVYEVAYKTLNAKMNQFYDRHKGVKHLKPEVIEEGQGRQEFQGGSQILGRTVLADIGIRVPVGLFTKLPYRAKKCSLYCTKPVTLHLDFCENTAKIGPAKRWDTAAIQHFRDLLKEATEVKAMVQALEDNVFQVFLFVTVKDEKICVNDDLVTKYFARYEEPKGNAEGSADDSDMEASLNAECVPVEFVGPTFVPRPKLPFGEKVSPHPETGEALVTTPHSLLRLLERKNWLLCRLCHLVLDEVEVLLSDTTEQVFTILDCYKKATARVWGNPPHQIVAVGTQWNKHIPPLMEEFMNDPYIVITVVEEAAICGNVQQVVQPCMNSSKIAQLLKILDFTHTNLQKVLVFTDSENEVEMIHKGSSVDQERTNARSVILLTENSPCHAPEILGYLKHAGAEIPQQLHDLAARVLESEEGEKLSRPLCASLKTFGICRNRTACPDRHQINVSIDMAQNIPDEMLKTPERVMILPLHIVHATNYFGRIVDKEKDQYAILAEEMQNYFKVPGHRIFVDTVEKSAFYGLCEGALCHRVQVVEIPAKEEENFDCKVTIKYIDEGRTSQVSSDQLLHLPAKFQSLPPQAVEFIVCRVKPIDNEIEWNPKVTDHIRHKIKGRLHHAKIVHTLGKTAWVDPVIRVSSLSNVKVWINEYNIRSEILSTGLGTDNPEHVEEIQKLCRHVQVSDYAENLEHLSIKEGTADLEVVSSPQDTSTEEDSPESYDVAPIEEAEDSMLHQHKCYHPEIKWFQDNKTVTLKVKIPSAADTKCEFFKEKVVFSARSGEKLYLADLELQESVFAEKSMCVIKDTEAVIVLAKEKQGAWCKLLKKKILNIGRSLKRKALLQLCNTTKCNAWERKLAESPEHSILITFPQYFNRITQFIW